MAHDDGLPKTGDAQEIGADAQRCLYANLPRNWMLPKDLGGTDDYGFDLQIQFVGDQQVKDIFRAQLKGTRSPQLIAGGEYFSIGLSASTLRYYDNVSEPTLLILCDLSVSPTRPKECPLYFVWIREELRRVRIKEVPLDQKEVNLRVPKKNLLTEDIDLLPDVRRANALAEVGHALDVSVSAMKPELEAEQRLAVVQGVQRSVGERSVAFADALAAPPKDFWIEPPRGTLDWHLWMARRHLNSGRLERCDAELLAAAPMLDGAKKLSLGEYWFLTGRLANAKGQGDKACELFRKAAEISDEARCWSAWGESELRRRYHPDAREDFSDIAAQMLRDEPQILSIKARLLAASGRYNDALALVDSFDGHESLAARAVVQTMHSKLPEALAACEAGLLSHDSPEPTRQLFLILKARARFNLAIASAQTADTEFIPPSGALGTDAELLKEAWADIQAATDAMDEIGWTSNAEFVVDMWAAAASMLGKQREILAPLLAAATKRPANEFIQSAAEAIAAQCGEFASALEVNDRLPESETQTLRRAAFLYELGRHPDCVELIDRRIASIDKQHQLYGSAVALAALSANMVARADLVHDWSELLDGTDELRAHRAVLDYFLAKESNKLGVENALAKLRQQDEQMGHPLPTTLALFQELDPGSKAQAEILLDVATRVRMRRRLSPIVAAPICAALATLERWVDLLALCKEAAREFDASPRLIAFNALALDRTGETVQARLVLESMLEGGVTDSLALNTYVNIMVRWGYVANALSATEKILASATNKPQQIECIRLLFNLVQTADPESPRLVDLAFRMGALATLEDEVEEGIFLQMVLIGTAFESAPMTSPQRTEFLARAEKFFERFPDSKVIKRVDISKSATGDEILRAIKEGIGLTEEKERFGQKIERQLQRGELPVPYVWRPKRFLTSVHDIAHLWELTKRSGADDKKYHLFMVGAKWNQVPLVDMRSHVPIIDLPTLFVLRDLDLFDQLFSLFPKIAIAQGTLEDLAKLTQIFSGSVFREKCIELQERLKKSVHQIAQPRAEVQVRNPPFSRASHEVKELARDARYLLYSDDVWFRTWCLESDDEPGGMCTLDLLTALEETAVLTTLDAARRIAQLCSWHVGIVILLRYQLAIVPDGLQKARSADEGVALLQASPEFVAVATAMWDFRSDYLQGLQHISIVVRQLLDQADLKSAALASLVGIWYVKAKVRPDAPHPALSILSKLVMMVAAHSPPIREDQSRRLWAIFMDLVEFEHKDRMDEAKEREARQLLAAEVAEIDAKFAKSGASVQDSLRDRLLRGLTGGTESAEVFSKAYDDARTRLSASPEPRAT